MGATTCLTSNQVKSDRCNSEKCVIIYLNVYPSSTYIPATPAYHKTSNKLRSRLNAGASNKRRGLLQKYIGLVARDSEYQAYTCYMS